MAGTEVDLAVLGHLPESGGFDGRPLVEA